MGMGMHYYYWHCSVITSQPYLVESGGEKSGWSIIADRTTTTTYLPTYLPTYILTVDTIQICIVAKGFDDMHAASYACKVSIGRMEGTFSLHYWILQLWQSIAQLLLFAVPCRCFSPNQPCIIISKYRNMPSSLFIQDMIVQVLSTVPYILLPKY